MKRRIWFDRTFVLGIPADAFPEILERVRGTPARLEERVAELRADILTARPPAGEWSVQENVGHLLDLEPLWSGRLDDLQRGEAVLREADLSNRRTHEAAHNERDIAFVLAGFRRAREALVARLDALGPSELGRQATHPRLGQPMTAMDLFYFVAEHDDHHLATITALLGALRAAP